MTHLWTDGVTRLGARARSGNHAGLAQHGWGWVLLVPVLLAIDIEGPPDRRSDVMGRGPV